MRRPFSLLVVVGICLSFLNTSHAAAGGKAHVTTFHSALSRGGSVTMHIQPGKADGSLVVRNINVADVPLRCMVANGESVMQHSGVFSIAGLPVNKTLQPAQSLDNFRAHEFSLVSDNYGTGFPSWGLTVKFLPIDPHRVNVYVQVESYPAEYTSCYADTPHAVKRFRLPN